MLLPFAGDIKRHCQQRRAITAVHGEVSRGVVPMQDGVHLYRLASSWLRSSSDIMWGQGSNAVQVRRTSTSITCMDI